MEGRKYGMITNKTIVRNYVFAVFCWTTCLESKPFILLDKESVTHNLALQFLHVDGSIKKHVAKHAVSTFYMTQFHDFNWKES